MESLEYNSATFHQVTQASRSLALDFLTSCPVFFSVSFHSITCAKARTNTAGSLALPSSDLASACRADSAGAQAPSPAAAPRMATWIDGFCIDGFSF